MSDDKEDETKETSINLVTEMEDLEVISVTEDMTDEVLDLSIITERDVVPNSEDVEATEYLEVREEVRDTNKTTNPGILANVDTIDQDNLANEVKIIDQETSAEVNTTDPEGTSINDQETLAEVDTIDSDALAEVQTTDPETLAEVDTVDPDSLVQVKIFDREDVAGDDIISVDTPAVVNNIELKTQTVSDTSKPEILSEVDTIHPDTLPVIDKIEVEPSAEVDSIESRTLSETQDVKVEESVGYPHPEQLESARIEPARCKGFLPLIMKTRKRSPSVSLKKKFVFRLPGPVGVALLADRSIAVACRNNNEVRRISSTGNHLRSLESKIGFDKPTDVLQLSSGKVVVRDCKGLQLFSEERKFLGMIGEEHCNKYYGLAEDGAGNIVTINTNASAEEGRGTTTERKQTDLFYFDQTGHLVKIFELRNLVNDEVRVRSMCRYLGYVQDKMFVVDMGLNSVYCIHMQHGHEETKIIGGRGDKIGRLRLPAGIAVDDLGNCIVVDSGNNRLQLIDSNCDFVGALKVGFTEQP